jgi:hypothetical protein
VATQQRFADVSQNLTTGIQVVALSALQSQSKYSEARRSAARILELQSAMKASVPILLSTVRRSGASCIEHHRNMSDIDVLRKVPLSLSAFNNSLATQKRPIVRELRRIGDGKVVQHDGTAVKRHRLNVQALVVDEVQLDVPVHAGR